MGMFHERFDLLVTPTVGVKPLLIGEELSDPAVERDWIDWAGFSYPFNMTRQPAISMPCGFTSDGLPVGIQLIGRLYADLEVLASAAALQSALAPVRIAQVPR
jgi:aspartyl-tRNA(Asn)/glutamyl-tRNA(Gln) amidotransferase subunit A